VELAKGNKLELKLAANPTTGYNLGDRLQGQIPFEIRGQAGIRGRQERGKLAAAGSKYSPSRPRRRVRAGGGDAVQNERFEKDNEPAKTYKFQGGHQVTALG